MLQREVRPEGNILRSASVLIAVEEGAKMHFTEELGEIMERRTKRPVREDVQAEAVVRWKTSFLI